MKNTQISLTLKYTDFDAYLQPYSHHPWPTLLIQNFLVLLMNSNIYFQINMVCNNPTLEWRHDDVTNNDVITQSQLAHFNRRPAISELVEEIICPRECDHMCIESNYGPVCACREGFRLYDDLRTCVLTEGNFPFSNSIHFHPYT